MRIACKSQMKIKINKSNEITKAQTLLIEGEMRTRRRFCNKETLRLNRLDQRSERSLSALRLYANEEAPIWENARWERWTARNHERRREWEESGDVILGLWCERERYLLMEKIKLSYTMCICLKNCQFLVKLYMCI
jgi:hypothetical protein